MEVDSWNLSFRDLDPSEFPFSSQLLNLVWESCHHNFDKRRNSSFARRLSRLKKWTTDHFDRVCMYIHPVFSNLDLVFQTDPALRFFSPYWNSDQAWHGENENGKISGKSGRNIWENSISNSTLVATGRILEKKKRTNFRIQPRSDFVHRAIELSALEHLFIRVIRTARIRPRLARTSSWKKFCEWMTVCGGGFYSNREIKQRQRVEKERIGILCALTPTCPRAR